MVIKHDVWHLRYALQKNFDGQFQHYPFIILNKRVVPCMKVAVCVGWYWLAHMQNGAIFVLLRGMLKQLHHSSLLCNVCTQQGQSFLSPTTFIFYVKGISCLVTLNFSSTFMQTVFTLHIPLQMNLVNILSHATDFGTLN